MSTKKLILILIAVTFLAYFSSFSNPFIWDDEQFITRNVYVQNFDIQKIFTTNTVAGAGVQSNYYRPLTTLSFAIDAKIWGQNPFGFHLTNFLLHLGAGLMLFFLLVELFSWGAKPGTVRYLAKAGAGLYPAFFIALFFLIHPVQTEAVTYINSRGDSLYAFFLFGSLWLFASSLRGRSKATDAAISKGSRLLRFARYRTVLGFTRNDVIRILAVIGFFVASLLSKEIALAGVGLFIVILILSFFRHSADSERSVENSRIRSWMRLTQDDNIKKGIIIIGLIVLIIIAYIILRFTVLRFANIVNFYGGDNQYTRSLAIRLFTFCKVLWTYLGLLLWPYPLHMERSIELVRSFFSFWVLGILGLFGGLGIFGIFEIKKRGTAWILFGLLWFLIMLVPSSGIIPINGILY